MRLLRLYQLYKEGIRLKQVAKDANQVVIKPAGKIQKICESLTGVKNIIIENAKIVNTFNK